MIVKILSLFLPWPLKRLILNGWFGYSIHKRAHIGFAWVFPRNLIMQSGTTIDHFTVAIHLDQIEMKVNATIGRNNWITGLTTNNNSLHFKHQPKRRAELILGEYAAITKSHHLDCTNIISIGPFSTVAGYNSQFLTHSIDVEECRQDSAPIYIGKYTFVGTNVVVLGGSVLPSYSILGAKSLLNKPLLNEWRLYGGVPAKELSEISKSAKYFNRTVGFVF